MKELTLKLTVQELQTMLQALGNLPYIQVQELIGNIQLQATPQLQSINKTPEEAGESSAKDAKEAEKVT